MSKAVITQTEGYIEQALKQYSITDAAIAKMESEYMKLKIAGLEDAEGYKLVRAARMDIKTRRIDVEKIRKTLKEDSLKFGRAVDGEARRITALLNPIEAHLQEQEKAIDNEKQRIKDEAANRERERIQDRIKKLYDIGVVFDGFGYVYNSSCSEQIELSGEQIKDMPDEEYEDLVAKIAVVKEKEVVVKAEQEAEKKAEADRVATIKAEQEAEAKRLKEKEDAIKAEQAKKDEELEAKREAIEAEKRAIEEEKKAKKDAEERQAEIDKAAKEAEDIAKKQAKETAAKEAAEKAEKERVAKMEAELAEKLKPDNEKLLAFADTLSALNSPDLANEQSHEILKEAQRHIQRSIQILRQGG